MTISTTRQPVILDAAIDHSVIRGTLTTPHQRAARLHGWLELNTALEALLDPGADHPSNATNGATNTNRRVLLSAPAGAASVPHLAGTTFSDRPVTNETGQRGPRA